MIHQLAQYIAYKLKAVNQHALHAPFIFDFYQQTIKNKHFEEVFVAIEKQRRLLLKNKNLIQISDYGAGSKVDNSTVRTIAAIAKSGLSTPRFSQTIYRMACFMKATTIVELGTSFGINTLYLAASRPSSKVFTFEGCEATLNIANQIFNQMEAVQIEQYLGNINKTLPEFLSTKPSIDLVYMDANHQYEPTLHYFNQLKPHLHANSLVVVDDIHWSKPMSSAWKALINDEKVTMSADIFDAGLLFFNPGLQKAHYILEY